MQVSRCWEPSPTLHTCAGNSVKSNKRKVIDIKQVSIKKRGRESAVPAAALVGD